MWHRVEKTEPNHHRHRLIVFSGCGIKGGQQCSRLIVFWRGTQRLRRQHCQCCWKGGAKPPTRQVDSFFWTSRRRRPTTPQVDCFLGGCRVEGVNVANATFVTVFVVTVFLSLSLLLLPSPILFSCFCHFTITFAIAVVVVVFLSYLCFVFFVCC